MKDRIPIVPEHVPNIENSTKPPKCQELHSPKLAKCAPPILLQRSEGFGNYFVAARQIEPGELIFEEKVLSASAYGLSERSPFCLSCYKDLAYSQKCKVCRWPICNETCTKATQHSSNECKVLAENKVQHKQREASMEYLAIETLRCLLLRDKHVQKWEQILSLEPHIGPRSAQGLALNETIYIVNFIRNRCKLLEFSEETIIRVLGIICINTFSGYQYVGRYVSLLFAQASFFNHDCTPNTTRKFSKVTNSLNAGALKFSIQVTAERRIMTGEVISTNYGDLTANIVDRGSFLKDHYFFHCDCHRCRCDLFNEIQHCILECSDSDTNNNV